jgi:hypothetical protein
VTCRRFGRIGRLAAAAGASALLLAASQLGGRGAPAAARAKARAQVPVYAYFYQWYTPSSWNRAKADYPLAGRYSSDDLGVLRRQVREARSAGIDGFLTSWKSTTSLNRRLDLLVDVAHEQGLRLGVVYEALDFQRHPLPISTVRHDMTYLVARWGSSLTSARFPKPVIIWTGEDQYSLADIASVRQALGTKAYLLAAAKNVTEYQRVAPYVDGDAYYWSSANPASVSTVNKLIAMGAAVHADHGIWIAPATSGYDGRTLGHTRVIDRAGGQTLVRSLNDAYASRPDAVGIISWNEWSENTYIEPGQRYGAQELTVLQRYLRGSGGSAVAADATVRRPNSGRWTGLDALLALASSCMITVVALGHYANRRQPPARRPAHLASPPPLEAAEQGDLSAAVR